MNFEIFIIQAEIAQRHALKEADDIPSGWRSVSEVDALKNLRQMYAMTEDDEEGNNYYKLSNCMSDLLFYKMLYPCNLKITSRTFKQLFLFSRILE